MIIDEKYAYAFTDYVESLQKLEEAFNKAGMAISFRVLETPHCQKFIEVIGGDSSQKLICIEADSPAQAVKDVAAGVRL